MGQRGVLEWGREGVYECSRMGYWNGAERDIGMGYSGGLEWCREGIGMRQNGV